MPFLRKPTAKDKLDMKKGISSKFLTPGRAVGLPLPRNTTPTNTGNKSESSSLLSSKAGNTPNLHVGLSKRTSLNSPLQSIKTPETSNEVHTTPNISLKRKSEPTANVASNLESVNASLSTADENHSTLQQSFAPKQILKTDIPTRKNVAKCLIPAPDSNQKDLIITDCTVKLTRIPMEPTREDSKTVNDQDLPLAKYLLPIESTIDHEVIVPSQNNSKKIKSSDFNAITEDNNRALTFKKLEVKKDIKIQKETFTKRRRSNDSDDIELAALKSPKIVKLTMKSPTAEIKNMGAKNDANLELIMPLAATNVVISNEKSEKTKRNEDELNVTQEVQPKTYSSSSKKGLLKRSLSLKKSTSSQDDEEIDDICLTSPSVFATETQCLQREVDSKRKMLEELKQIEVYKKLHDIGKVQELTLQWKQGCVAALNDLVKLIHEKDPSTDPAILLAKFKLPTSILNELDP